VWWKETKNRIEKKNDDRKGFRAPVVHSMQRRGSQSPPPGHQRTRAGKNKGHGKICSHCRPTLSIRMTKCQHNRQETMGWKKSLDLDTSAKGQIRVGHGANKKGDNSKNIEWDSRELEESEGEEETTKNDADGDNMEVSQS